MLIRWSVFCVALAAATMSGCHSTSSRRPSYYQAQPAVVNAAPAPCATSTPCPTGQLPPAPPPGF